MIEEQISPERLGLTGVLLDELFYHRECFIITDFSRVDVQCCDDLDVGGRVPVKVPMLETDRLAGGRVLIVMNVLDQGACAVARS